MRPFHRSRITLGVVALLTLSGCGFSGGQAQQGTATPTADTNQRIVVDNFRAPVANWALESDAAYVLSLSGCLETLTSYDAAKGEVVPMLATDGRSPARSTGTSPSAKA